MPIPVKRKSKNFIQDAIKRPGALTKLVGGKPSEHLGKVKQIAKSGTPLQKRQASFYLNVLRKVNRKKSSKKSLMK